MNIKTLCQCYNQCRINLVQTLVFYSVNYQSGLDTGWTLYIYCRKITFSTVGIKLGQLFPNIVPTLVINSRSPTSDQHLTDRQSRQSVMFSAWVVANQQTDWNR